MTADDIISRELLRLDYESGRVTLDDLLTMAVRGRPEAIEERRTARTKADDIKEIRSSLDDIESAIDSVESDISSVKYDVSSLNDRLEKLLPKQQPKAKATAKAN